MLTFITWYNFLDDFGGNGTFYLLWGIFFSLLVSPVTLLSDIFFSPIEIISLIIFGIVKIIQWIKWRW